MTTRHRSRRRTAFRLATLALFVGGLLASADRCQAQGEARLDALPTIDPPVNREDSGVAITNDGIVVGNQAQIGGGPVRAVRWPISGVGVGIGLLPDANSSFASAVTEDGSIIVGTCTGSFGSRAFRWTAATGMTSIPALSENPGTLAFGISANGAFIAGSGAAAGSPSWSRAARWNAELEPIDLGFLSVSIPSSSGYGISADGRVVVGSSYASPTETRAVRWKAGVLTNLGVLAEISGAGYARAASADGGIVVGYQDASSVNRAWRWTLATGMNALPRLDSTSPHSRAFDISDDGRVIVGREGPDNVTYEACVWIDGEPFDLKTLLASRYGVAVGNWTLLSANGVSPDGKYVTGQGIYQGQSQAFRAYLPNQAPTAKAGRNIVIMTKGDEGRRVKLDGRDSFDPEDQPLKYRWSAPRIRFDDPTSARPSALFPVGKTTVTLRVTDSDRATDTDTVQVTVRPRQSQPQAEGEAANLAFAEAAALAGAAAASGGSNATTLEAATLAAQADALGAAVGDLIVWNDGESIDEATLRYAELRRLQSLYGYAASAKLAEAFLSAGDPGIMEAAAAARLGTLNATADLATP